MRPNQSSFFVSSIGVGGPLGHVCNEENNGKNEAEGAYNDVAHGKEVVLTTQHISGGQNKTLRTIEGTDRIDVVNLKIVCALFERYIDLSPKLAEVGQTSSSHPNDEVRIFDISPLESSPILCYAVHFVAIAVFELIFSIGLPGNVSVVNIDLCSISS